MKQVGGSQPSLWQNLAGRWRSQLFCRRLGHIGFRTTLSGIFSGSLSFTGETHFMRLDPKHGPTLMNDLDLRHSKGRSNPQVLFWGLELHLSRLEAHLSQLMSCPEPRLQHLSQMAEAGSISG